MIDLTNSGRRLQLLLPALLLAVSGYAQPYLRSGDALPDLAVGSVRNYDDTTLRLRDFAGKLLILDFWTVYCASCIASMPELQALQERFADQLQIILVTSSTREEVDQLYARSAVARNIQLPSIIADTVLTRFFEFRTVPTHVWIDEDGKVMQITGSAHTNASTVARYLAGEAVDLPPKREHRDLGDMRHVSLLNEGGGRHFDNLLQYSALLSKISDDGRYDGPFFDSGTGRQVGIKMVNATLSELYLRAYSFSGMKADPSRLVLETADSARFIPPESGMTNKHAWREQNLFSYESKLSPGRMKEAAGLLRRDLDAYFGYRVTVESRMVPCLTLVVIDSAKVPSSTGGPERAYYHDETGATIQLEHAPVGRLLGFLPAKLRKGLPLVDGTELQSPVDLALVIDVPDLITLNDGLSHYGLKLVEGNRELDMVIIRDAVEAGSRN
ncbi:TlpA family protein disulfide reductase [Parapedobacter deserti]|uniref:TlpA family protein disulfide reductase n=2 Tax=Parapedobacter deserti TaxID=1912957 RepID=A0ABV7JQX4_9SPHI